MGCGGGCCWGGGCIWMEVVYDLIVDGGVGFFVEEVFIVGFGFEG